MAEATNPANRLQTAESFILEGLSCLQSAQQAAKEAGDATIASDIEHAASIARAVAKHIKGKLTANAD